MQRSILFATALLVVAILVAGCTTAQPPAQPATPAPLPPTTANTPAPTAQPAPVVPAMLSGGWTLTMMGIQNGNAVTVPTTEITLTINPDNSLTGYGGCNNYFATFALTGKTTPKGQEMTVSNLGSTKKYCATESGQEQQYLNILGKTMAYNVDGAQLSLTATTGDVLIYQRPKTLITPTPVPQPA